MSGAGANAPRFCLRGRLLRWLGQALARLSPQRTQRLGRWLSRVPGLNASRRRIAARNIEACFAALPPDARTRLLARALASNTTGALDTLRGWFAPGRLDGLARVRGLEHLHAALAAGRGAVVVGAHYDGIEIAMRLVAEASGQAMPILVRRYNDPCLEREIDAGRRRYCGHTYDKKDVAGFVEAVRAGQAAFYVPDQNANRRTVFVPFHGVRTATLGAIGGVIARTGGAPLMMWCRRGDDGRYDIDLEPPPPGWPGPDEAGNAARYMAWIEERLREDPAQYLWVHRRFKTRPPGEPPFYR
ncbi:lysophospholipid acyltransferase family protein [Pseudoxanthomonas mexicana]|uniref:lysophospholipid acyltransferase family protein n=1 Tax=Pseudoxanthomonas mexicana TaxID=128785 RepID=UPI00398AE3D3